MKIAAIRNFLNAKAGAQGAFLNMMNSLSRRHHEIDIYVLNISDELKYELEEHGFKVTSLDFNEWRIVGLNPFRTINDLRAMYRFKKLAKKINASDYDVAFTDHADYSPLIHPFLKIPKVYYCYEPPRKYYEPPISNDVFLKIYKIVTFLSKFLDKYCVKYADLVLSNSDYISEYIWRVYGIFPITNYLGVDLEKYKKLNIEKENLVISVAILKPPKAHDFVIRSIGMIPKDKRPRFVIITAGITSDKEEMKLYKLAEQNNVDLEIKNTYISDEEFAELHCKAKVVAIAYIMEPSIEPVALAFETPIVAVREGGARETIINGETGILTNRDEREFAQAIEYLLDNPDIASEMGKKGQDWIKKNFMWDKCAENLERNLERVLKGQR